jgi:hypothetical protein
MPNLLEGGVEVNGDWAGSRAGSLVYYYVVLNQLRKDPFHIYCTPGVPLCVSFNSLQGPPLSSLSVSDFNSDQDES